MAKALSPIVSSVLLIVIALSLASFIAPWMYELVITTTNQTGSTAQQQVHCRYAGLDFDSDYGSYGVSWNFTGNGTDTIKAKIVNTGNVDLWGFSFEVTLETLSEDEIRHYGCTNDTVIGSDDPLLSSRSAIIEANITADINGTLSVLREVRVFNSVCPDLAPSLEL